MVDGTLWVLRILPPLKLIAMIYICSWNIAENGAKTRKNRKKKQSVQVEAVLDKTYSKYKSDLSFAIFKAIRTRYVLYDIATQY